MLCWILISLFVGFLKAQEVIYAQIGGTVTLPRENIEAGNAYVNWYRGNDEFITISRNPQGGIQRGEMHDFEFMHFHSTTHADLLPDFSLKISPVQESDFEIWRCEQYVLLKKFEKTYKLYHDLSRSPDTIYTSSSKVNIPCSLSSNIPWSILKETGLRGGNWSFTPLSDPKLTQSLLSLSFDPVVRWNDTQHSDGTVKDKGRELKDQDLSINLPVSENIRGVYTCDLIFSTKTLSRKVQVEVLKVSSSGGSRVYEGQSVNLTCTLGHHNTSGLGVKWNCSSCSVFSGLNPHPSTLSIPEVKVEHSGKWTCELWKEGKKLTSAVLSLKIEKAPVDIWLCVAISSGVVVFILLLVIIIKCIRRHRQVNVHYDTHPQQNQMGFYKT
uniref:Uncharacterized LOC107755530 n=1 Tax=Sinocyclocheilus rhinocerous TaxID=307959 RepID=A0A673IYC1_9TELE